MVLVPPPSPPTQTDNIPLRRFKRLGGPPLSTKRRPSPERQPESQPLIYGFDEPYDSDGDPLSLTPEQPSSDTPSNLRRHVLKAMDRLKRSKARYYADKLAVEAEPGLTNAQLMLTNHDLKP
ncbi:MAG: hypothetical protein Q9214_001016, partial [Letrouitia sp. 1 TL-2023]